MAVFSGLRSVPELVLKLSIVWTHTHHTFTKSKMYLMRNMGHSLNNKMVLKNLDAALQLNFCTSIFLSIQAKFSLSLFFWPVSLSHCPVMRERNAHRIGLQRCFLFGVIFFSHFAHLVITIDYVWFNLSFFRYSEDFTSSIARCEAEKCRKKTQIKSHKKGLFFSPDCCDLEQMSTIKWSALHIN